MNITHDKEKSIIKEALNNVDTKRNKKVIFHENLDLPDKPQLNGNVIEEHKTLFESDCDNSEDEFDFNVKPQFCGKKGQQLFELQSRYKGDKRFALDERFIDTREENAESSLKPEHSIEDEKKLELDILQQVLGTKLKTKDGKSQEDSSKKKRMLRYDPTQSDYIKFHVSAKTEESSAKKKTKKSVKDVQKDENGGNEDEQPLVSKDVFYKVDENLKTALHEKQEFSLLNLFGKEGENEENAIDNCQENEEKLPKKKLGNNVILDKNPFHYDSSDNEIEEDIEKNTEKFEANDKVTPKPWYEPFFLKNDDYRLQEGSDFVKRIASENKVEFGQQRREIKDIVKAKVRNNQRRNNPFKKKLGGSKRKKMLRIKKAMKR